MAVAGWWAGATPPAKVMVKVSAVVAQKPCIRSAGAGVCSRPFGAIRHHQSTTSEPATAPLASRHAKPPRPGTVSEVEPAGS